MLQRDKTPSHKICKHQGGGFSSKFRELRREHSGLCDRRDLAKFAGKPPDRGNFLTRAEVHAWQDCPDLIYLTRYEKMYSVNVAIRERKLPLSRSSTLSSSFWLSHIARYAPEPARRNLAHCCDPDVNIFCGMGSKLLFYKYQKNRGCIFYYATPVFISSTHSVESDIRFLLRNAQILNEVV